MSCTHLERYQQSGYLSQSLHHPAAAPFTEPALKSVFLFLLTFYKEMGYLVVL
jgi:hypothetical protein